MEFVKIKASYYSLEGLPEENKAQIYYINPLQICNFFFNSWPRKSLVQLILDMSSGARYIIDHLEDIKEAANQSDVIKKIYDVWDEEYHTLANG